MTFLDFRWFIIWISLIFIVSHMVFLISHIDASLSRQTSVKGKALVRYEVNAVMLSPYDFHWISLIFWSTNESNSTEICTRKRYTHGKINRSGWDHRFRFPISHRGPLLFGRISPSTGAIVIDFALWFPPKLLCIASYSSAWHIYFYPLRLGCYWERWVAYSSVWDHQVVSYYTLD